jgi:hypothetical protein
MLIDVYVACYQPSRHISFPLRDYISIYDLQDCTLTLETDDNRLAANSPDILIITVVF